MACQFRFTVLLLGVSLACGPGIPEDTLGSDAGDGDPGDGDPGDSNAGDGDPGDADGEAETTGATGDGDPDPSGDGDPDPSGDGDGDNGTDCAALGFLMAPCDGVNGVCLDGWTCHFYDSVDIYGVSPVGNCSPPCEVDADCGWMGQFGGMCSDPDIVCEAYGADGVPRCILPCQADSDCYQSHQYCDENLGLCLTNST